MSLLRLLTSGKSLVGVQVSGGRYHPARQGALPKFSTRNNPFRATTRPSSATARKSDLGIEGGEPAASSAREAKPAAVAAAAKGPTPQQPARKAAVFGGPKVGSWVARVGAGVGEQVRRGRAWLTGWMRPRRAKAQAVAPLPPFKKPLVQAELSLEAVKVVRNDLSDSDLEVVTAKPTKVKVPAPGAGAATAERAPAGSSWGRVAGRMFSAGKT
jgi:hypothetical protein